MGLFFCFRSDGEDVTIYLEADGENGETPEDWFEEPKAFFDPHIDKNEGVKNDEDK